MLLQLVIFAAILLTPAWPSIKLPSIVQWTGGVFLLIGGIFGTAGVICLGKNLTPFPRPKEKATLVQNCIYGTVRHPVYTGIIFGTLGWSVWREHLPGIVLAMVLFQFFNLKSRREEDWLLEKFPGYADYRNRVRRLIPWIY